MLTPLNILGIMTGNSLDGADLVITKYSPGGTQTDLLTHSLTSPEVLKTKLKWLRQVINDAKGNVAEVAKIYCPGNNKAEFSFDEVSDSYINFIAQAVSEINVKAKKTNITIDLIGLHGQTCAHCPPSIAKSKDANLLYTVQIADGQKLADLSGIPVVFDFRSDDLMNLGEAAPLAPVHHQHLANQTRKKGQFPIAFCNAGNTGNITFITENKASGELQVQGWDTGPFNNFPDKLMQAEKNMSCDESGEFGKKGKVNLELLGKLFHQAVITKDGENFLMKKPPRSSDPEWYKMLPELVGGAISFEDRLRTAEYFSAYIYFHTLGFLSLDYRMPAHFAVCGGGWKNPISFEHFKGLVSADFVNNPVLSEHKEEFSSIAKRIKEENNFTSNCEPSEWYGFDGTAMEARIFADAAFCRLRGEPFSLPSTTGVSKPTVAGIIRFPKGVSVEASPINAYFKEFNSQNLTLDRPDVFDSRWSQASAGWIAS